MSEGDGSSGNANSGDKAPDAFRTISEVAGELDLPQHVLRFWETRFNQIKPLKRGGGRRYYRPQDVELLRGIRHLLYSEGYTIRGVQRILREQGPRFVVAAAHGAVETAIVAPVAATDDDEDGAGAMARRLAAGHGRARTKQPEPEATEPPPPASPSPPIAGEAAGPSLSADEVRRLEATLSDLLEMKRLLDQAR